ncbi:MAG TPA: MFS transporter [Rhizobiaceae bacterium]|nr:MFS transporter [Rhizobiaceae bacterium]
MKPEAVRGRDQTIGLLMIGGFATGINIRLMDTVLPQVAEEYMVSVGLTAQIVTAYALGYGIMQIGLGITGDRFGKVRLVAILCFASALACLAAALAQSLGQLTIARFLCGAAASAMIPVSLAWIGDMFPYEERPVVLARYASGGILGMIAGQIAGGLLTEYWNWRVGLAFVALAYFVAGLGLIVQLRRDPLISAQPLQAQVRLSPTAAIARMLRRPWSRIVLASVFIEGISVFAAITFVGIELRERFDAGYGLIGAMLAFFAVGGMLFTTSARRIVPHFNQPKLIVTGSAISAAGLLCFALTPVMWLVPLAISLVGFGAYMLHNTLQSFATQLLPEARATGFSFFATLYFLSQSLGVASAALFLDDFGAAPIFAVAAIVVGVFGLWFATYGSRFMPAS